MKKQLLNMTLIIGFVFIGSTHAALSQDGRKFADEAKKIVESVVEKSGYSFLGQGSWLNPKKTFRSSSDVDLESFILSKKPTNPSEVAQWRAQLVRQWKQAQKDVIAAVKAKYPDPKMAEEALAKINLYPPNQLMDEFESGEDAVKFFKKNNMVPNLKAANNIHTGRTRNVAELGKDLEKYSEGLYGKDARRWIQNDRASPGNGRIFYRDSKTGKAVTGRFMNLEHAMQGGGKYTVEGSMNISSQFIDKIMEDIDNKDIAKASKSLKRLKKELTILEKKLGKRVDISKIERLIKAGKFKEAKFLLRQSKLEVEMIKFATSPKELSMIKKLLAKGGKASKKLMEKLSKIPYEKIGNVVQGVLITFQAIQFGADITQGEYAKALTDVGLAVSPAAIMILGTITQLMMDAAKELGIALVSGRQDCLDMLSGIYPDNPSYVVNSRLPDMTYEKLLIKYPDSEEDKLYSLIIAHAQRSSNKEKVAKLNEEKCLSSVIRQWKEAREAYGRLFMKMANLISFSVVAQIKKDFEPDDEMKRQFDGLMAVKDEFNTSASNADRYANQVQRYYEAIQNATGSQDAQPCKNPYFAYLLQNIRLSFKWYSEEVLRIGENEFVITKKFRALKKKLSMPANSSDQTQVGMRTVTASLKFHGPSLTDVKQKLDGYSRFVSAEGGRTLIFTKWYLDGESSAFGENAEFTGLAPGPHAIEVLMELQPYGPKDKTLKGMEYKVDLINGAQIEIPELDENSVSKKRDELIKKMRAFEETSLPQISGMVTGYLNRTATLGDMVMQCNNLIVEYGCDENEMDNMADDIARKGYDPDDVANALREICGDGVDNNGNGLIDEDCQGNGTAIITVFDDGTIADDAFSLSVTGYGNLGSTPAGGQRVYTINLPPGHYTATLTCILAPDDAGTYSIIFSGSASGNGGSGVFGGVGESASYQFVVQ
ncbi:MAG: hypothetical protein GXO82_04155 [Chlorobi bacterium]|nr:hypothetical protein [Chlorobiota bacterium]